MAKNKKIIDGIRKRQKVNFVVNRVKKNIILNSSRKQTQGISKYFFSYLKKARKLFLVVDLKRYWNESVVYVKSFRDRANTYLHRNQFVFTNFSIGILLGSILITIVLGVWLTGIKLTGMKDGIVYAAGEGIDGLKSGVEKLKEENFSVAEYNFAKAETNFVKIQNDLEKLGQGNKFLDGSLPGDQYKNVENLLTAMTGLSKGAKLLSKAIGDFSADESGKFSPMLLSSILEKNNDVDVFVEIEKIKSIVKQSSQEFERAYLAINNVDENLVPAKYRLILNEAKKDAPRYLGIMRAFNSLMANDEELLGKNIPAKYLLLFQNNNEIRPTGGFIGSYGIAEMNQGKMENLFFDDIYNPDGQMLEQINPPYPINMMTPVWAMRDSNWNPDFRLSADNAVRMFEKEGGYSVDGVIAFTPEIITRLLVLVGPIEMKDYDVILDENNFIDIVQQKVELDYDKEQNQPKKILADLLPILMKKMSELPNEKKKLLWQTVLDLLNEKHILIYSYNPEIENLIVSAGWAGEMKQTDDQTDYLSIVNANIGGRKSDAYMRQAVKQSININEQGEILVDLEITRKNIRGWEWPNYSNYDYMRVYVPRGCELLSVEGFVNPEGMIFTENGFLVYDKNSGQANKEQTKVYQENGKTVFANWVITDPWGVSVAKYQYKLPFKIKSGEYNLFLQKQSGQVSVDYMLVIDYLGKELLNSSQTVEKTANGEYVLKNDLAKDVSLESSFRI